MNVPAPHFLLFSEARGKDRQGQWRFVLQAADGSATLEAADFEPEVCGERLELLAVVRGLEALDQPSNVTLFTPSKYVNRGIAYGLEEWRRNDWTWECFGEMVPVKNGDLWQRLDRALSFHRIEFRGYRFDGPHRGPFRRRLRVGRDARRRGKPSESRGDAVSQGLARAIGPAGERPVGRLEIELPAARNLLSAQALDWVTALHYPEIGQKSLHSTQTAHRLATARLNALKTRQS